MNIVEQFITMLKDASLSSLAIFIFSVVAIMSYSQGRKFLHTLRYISDFLVAVDQALEHSLKNGYAKRRDEVLKRLQEKRKYVEET